MARCGILYLVGPVAANVRLQQLTDLTYLIPVLLAVRVVIDLIGLASGGFS